MAQWQAVVVIWYLISCSWEHPPGSCSIPSNGCYLISDIWYLRTPTRVLLNAKKWLLSDIWYLIAPTRDSLNGRQWLLSDIWYLISPNRVSLKGKQWLFSDIWYLIPVNTHQGLAQWQAMVVFWYLIPENIHRGVAQWQAMVVPWPLLTLCQEAIPPFLVEAMQRTTSTLNRHPWFYGDKYFHGLLAEPHFGVDRSIWSWLFWGCWCLECSNWTFLTSSRLGPPSGGDRNH